MSSSACLGAGVFVWIVTTIPVLLAMSTAVTYVAQIIRSDPKKVN